MLSIFVAVVANVAILMGLAFILSKTVPSIRNKVCRFVFLFVLGVPLNFVINYVNAQLKYAVTRAGRAAHSSPVLA